MFVDGEDDDEEAEDDPFNVCALAYRASSAGGKRVLNLGARAGDSLVAFGEEMRDVDAELDAVGGEALPFELLSV